MRRLLRLPALTLLLSIVLLARVAPAAEVPSLKEAEAQLKRGDIDDLFDPFRRLIPGQHPEGDTKVAAFLVRASRAALKQGNALLAFDIADKATQLNPRSVEAFLAGADAAEKMGNEGFERSALEMAQQLAPDNAEVLKRLGRLGETEGTAETPPEAPPAETLTNVRPPSSDEAEIPGYAARSSEHFRIVYSEGKRDFAQKARYEQRCLDLFERAYQRVTTKLGAAPAGQTDVVLYTKEEFALHFGGSFGNSVLGFFAGKIRMNRAEAIDDAFFDTAVHEFTHAVIDSIAHGKSEGIPFWLHEGLAHWTEKRTSNQELLSPVERLRLKQLAKRQSLPTMEVMAHQGFTSFGSAAWVAYDKSALAIDELMIRGPGLAGMKRVIAAVGEGTPFEAAFATEFGADCLSKLDDDVASELLE